ncbi:MAG: helix-turn-helix domain-containing protein [Oscillospiraceae bacterium]|nr:helix-turn-helix domain-containing protein [Oscillospiraceae bacterium]
MFDQIDFGKRLKEFRERRKLTQKEAAVKIGVSEQALSKWENGVCLPDVYHLKYLARVLNVSADCLLDTENDGGEKVVDIIKVGGAVFEIVEKPETVFAGKMLYAKDFSDISAFNSAIDAFAADGEDAVYDLLTDSVLPVYDIHLSVNFWLGEKKRAYGFVREVSNDSQPESVDVYKMPASLYIRAYTDSSAAQLLAKEQCEIWELFAYIRNYFMPAHGFKMADNGAQELEVFDTSEHSTGYAYMPVQRC